MSVRIRKGALQQRDEWDKGPAGVEGEPEGKQLKQAKFAGVTSASAASRRTLSQANAHERSVKERTRSWRFRFLVLNEKD